MYYSRFTLAIADAVNLNQSPNNAPMYQHITVHYNVFFTDHHSQLSNPECQTRITSLKQVLKVRVLLETEGSL